MIKYFAFILIFQALTGVEAPCSVADPKVILMRHGEAMHNIEDVYNSNPASLNYTPAHLTESGRAQALASAKKLLEEGFTDDTISTVYVSPLPRTEQTAHILAATGLFSKDKIKTEPRIIEVQMGDLEGKPIIHAWQNSLADQYHVETDEQIDRRVQEFYNHLVSTHQCGHVIVVTHGLVARKLAHLLGESKYKLTTGEAKVFPLNK
jgi:broad specificity phosphatase PhoE